MRHIDHLFQWQKSQSNSLVNMLPSAMVTYARRSGSDEILLRFLPQLFHHEIICPAGLCAFILPVQDRCRQKREGGKTWRPLNVLLKLITFWKGKLFSGCFPNLQVNFLPRCGNSWKRSNNFCYAPLCALNSRYLCRTRQPSRLTTVIHADFACYRARLVKPWNRKTLQTCFLGVIWFIKNWKTGSVLVGLKVAGSSFVRWFYAGRLLVFLLYFAILADNSE